ncbi:MAG: MBL fold metallo-hydrolase [Rhodobacteraceae bacterium]|nr:MBL fold metallo-hydrolase [Paracoccaceae bacterium]
MTAEQIAFQAGVAVPLAKGICRVLAPNPSPMTYHGTNSYLVGEQELAVIDPGPDLPDHLAALLAAINGRKVSHILITHSHLDHSPLAAALSRETGAPIYAFGPSDAGQSPIMRELAAKGLTGGGEGVDHNFRPDILLADGETVAGRDWQITAHHTPGHFGNHLCFAFGEHIFSGDLVMDWATSLVSPPDGDLTDFRASCRAMRHLNAKILWPGHGGPVQNPKARIDWLLNHRQDREDQIIAALSAGKHSAATLTKAIYTDIQPALWPMAERNVFAHLIDLYARNRISAEPELSIHAEFALM